jgi:hypothetical protein
VAGTVIPPSQRAPNARIDANTDAVVLKCLAKNPADRFESTEDFCDALRDCVDDRAFLRDAERLAGIRESGFDFLHSIPDERRRQSPARVPLDDPDDFSNTRRFRPARAKGPRSLMIGAALVVLIGASLALWLRREKSTPGVLYQTAAAATVRSTPPPSSISPTMPTTVAHPPAIQPPALPAFSGPSAGLTLLAQPPSNASNESKAVRPHRLDAERGARRMPVMPPLSHPTPSAPASPEPSPPAVALAQPPAGGANPAEEAEVLVREAQQAWVRQYYAVAIYRARSALALSPDLPLAHQIITLCSCALHKTEDAKAASLHLDPAKRTSVRTLCEKNGITLDSE